LEDEVLDFKDIFPSYELRDDFGEYVVLFLHFREMNDIIKEQFAGMPGRYPGNAIIRTMNYNAL
jgi:hypothetical protein